MRSIEPTFSVVIPLYNKRSFVKRSIDSVLRQKFVDFELIVVDDGSTDDSLAIVRDNFSDSRLQLLQQENLGPGAARNYGVRVARGKYVAFLDADDEWLPDFLERARVILQGNANLSAVSLGFVWMPDETTALQYYGKHGVSSGLVETTPDSNILTFARQLDFMLPCTTVVRRDVVTQFGGFYDGDKCLFGEDSHLWLQILLNCRVCFDLEPKAVIHRDASELNIGRERMRGIEPFLQRPELVRQNCPTELIPLLERFLQLRANKSARMLGYWGRWQEARCLRKRFALSGQFSTPYYWSALVSSSPLALILGPIARSVARLLRLFR